ncbi:MAG TPA: CPBP family intramembrane glutamic endopeptidase [Rubrobacter sp.]|nr:CPBP family intramembrane glutamic endopeptidase [Rubrobacter sp.]
MRSTLRAIVVEPQQALLSIVLLDVALVGFTVGTFWAGVFVVRSLGRTPSYSLAPLGFSSPRVGLLVGAGVGVLTGLGALLISWFVNPASAFILDRLGYSTESRVQQPFMRGLEGWVRESPAAAIPAIVFVVILFGPAVEELVFRGAIFNGLYRLGGLLSAHYLGKEGSRRTAKRVSFALSALISSVIFALLHLEPVLFPALVILAVILCALFERTGSLLPSFVAHATFNSFAVLLIILSGLDALNLPPV